ncbi:putative Serpin family protein [Rosa chinensis]|uniref:Putative Serpin family protein n=1 Tax=Rosa chinensis TaxID=74649 RepID=A0A2P6S393_ROSCH|nr:serpin-ZX [Rosa chinensis]PRQ53137.1 putative Serpin family protein [Rosa chinensis]
METRSVDGVPYMTSCFGGCHSISAFDGFKVLNLSYKGSSDYKDHRCFSMHLLLPDARNGLPALVERVCSESGFLDRHLIKWNMVRAGRLLIPKFKISSRFEASCVLEKLVLGGVGANTNIFHQAVIEVNEDGTTAAAATVAIWVGASAPPPQEIQDFVADHPCIHAILIREGGGTVLFMGQVLNPLAG